MNKPAAAFAPRAPVSMPEPSTLFCLPRASLWSVKEVAEEYALFTLPPMDKPLVLDVGANAGVFALAAMERWPGAVVHCFEPHPETCDLLDRNLAGSGATIVRVAVDHPVEGDAVGELHEGVNRLCCSLVDRSAEGETVEGSVQVDLLDSCVLPPCAVLKIDTEGKEVAILRGYQHLASVQVLLVEVHKQEDFEVVCKMALAAGLSPLDQRNSTLRFRRKTSGDKDRPHFTDCEVVAQRPQGAAT